MAWDPVHLPRSTLSLTLDIIYRAARSALIALVTFIPVLASISSFVRVHLSYHTDQYINAFLDHIRCHRERSQCTHYFLVIATLQCYSSTVVLLAHCAFKLIRRCGRSRKNIWFPLSRGSCRIAAYWSWDKEWCGGWGWFYLGDDQGIHQRSDQNLTTNELGYSCVKDSKASPKKSSPSRRRWWEYFSKRKAVEELPLLPVKDNEERESNPESEKPFQLTDITLQVPKGSFVAIVGRVGSGKVSLNCEPGAPLFKPHLEFPPSSFDWRNAQEQRPCGVFSCSDLDPFSHSPR